MEQALYEILVPAGGPVAHATAQYLQGQLKVPVHIEPRTIYMDGQSGPYEVVSVKAQDSPQTDSHIKQTAAYVAEVVGSANIIASKSGPGGIQTWPIRNTATETGSPSRPLKTDSLNTRTDSAKSPPASAMS